MEHLLTPYGAALEIPARSVLVLAPHPDDEALGCGGAIIRHVQSGVPVRVVIATDGALERDGTPHTAQVLTREAESRAAAGVLGYGEPEFWRLPDQGLSYGEPLVQRVLGLLDDVDLVYAPSLLEMHPDHRALAMAAAEAVRRRGAGVRIAFYEVGVPLRPNLLLDISAVEARKQAAVRCFASQLIQQPYDEHIAALNRFRTYTLPPTVRAAEAYAVVDAAELAADPLGIYRTEAARQRELGLALTPEDAPLVSVIVRSQNRPELAEALDSIALQTYGNIEVVVVDAGERRIALPPSCGRFPLRVVGEGKLARSRAANAGLDAALGEYVVFLDDDDLFCADHVARLAAGLRARPDVRAIYSGVRVEREGRVVDTYDAAFRPAMLMAWNRLPIHAVMFARSLATEGCRFDETLDAYEDWDFWLQVSGRTAYDRVPGVSAVYRIGQRALQTDEAGWWAEHRDRFWRKWLGRWEPGDLESLIATFRQSSARDERSLADAAFTEGELRRLLVEEDARRQKAESRVAYAEEALAAIKASTSWRLTWPIRALMELVRPRRVA
jgi:LmbE family N-acetylglucosaminyl deacetylase